jgi:hypothetical protein
VLRFVASALGLVALVAAMVVGALAATGVLGEPATSSRVGGSQAETQEEPTLVKPATRSIDRSVVADKLSWTVDEARLTNVVHGVALPPDPLRGDFVVVTFSVENVSDGPVTLNPESLVLVDEEGRKSPPAASVNTEYVVPKYAILFNEGGLLDPGEKNEGKAVFDLSVPFGVNPSADLSGFRLQLGDGDPTKKEEEYVDLGF